MEEIDIERAWHILSLILKSNRPLSLVSLSSFSLLFEADPNYIIYLCNIPNSPISLTVDFLVAPSKVAVRAISNFVSNLFVSKKRPVWRVFDENEKVQHGDVLMSEAPFDCTKALLSRGDYITKRVSKQPKTMHLDLENVFQIVEGPLVSINLSNGQLGCGRNNINVDNCKRSSMLAFAWEHDHAQSFKCQTNSINVKSSSNIADLVAIQNTKVCMSYPEQLMQTTRAPESITWRESKTCDMSFAQKTTVKATTCMEVQEESSILPVEAENVSHACQANIAEVVKDETVDNSKTEKTLAETMMGTVNAATCMELEVESRVSPVDSENVSHACRDRNAKIVEEEVVANCNTEQTLVRHEGDSPGPACQNDEVAVLHDANGVKLSIDLVPSICVDITTARVDNKDSLVTCNPSFHHKPPSNPSARINTSKKNALNSREQVRSQVFGNNEDNILHAMEMQCTRDKSTMYMKKIVNQNHDGTMRSKREHDNSQENREKPTAIALKEPKPLPNFELYTVEEEEGSGGYGTVYRARRKSDGVIFAIKCPHEKANKTHVDNELKMLERFGGKNSVIKFEGSFKSRGSECLVLEHVQHDRPEILKRDIEVPQLQWYGYCMFRALAALHKQGIVHRDVKPGNFLFSCKTNQGFLIDFNLAMDLEQKYGARSKPKLRHNVSSNQVPPVHAKTIPLASKKFLLNKPTELTSKNFVKSSKLQGLPKTPKSNAAGDKNALFGQGADGSGVSSAKDATSTKISSRDKTKEPIMFHGKRKALVAYAHQSRESANSEAQNTPALKRKRVSALPRKVDNKNVCITPMPLFCNGTEVAGSGQIKDDGDRKQKREGPCAGTKGFRAPEVLFRSAHQGPKLDVWSAGVTLLYLIIGRTPFTGEPGQNIKDIAKLRGSEDLWEVAKLHNRESSFPQELLDVQFFSSVKLRDWCKRNTRRPEFIKKIPISLFDLVDKCLTVNPRSRLSAEEAFRHDFFTPCHLDLRRAWLQRKELSSDPGTSYVSQ